MQRTSPFAEIFGYLVCLITVAVFFMSAAGIVNNAFRVVNPTAHPRLMVRGMAGPPGGNAYFWRRKPVAPLPGTPGEAMPALPGANGALRANFTADARYDATRRLVLAIVMLVLSILVFRRAFGWLNPREAAA